TGGSTASKAASKGTTRRGSKRWRSASNDRSLVRVLLSTIGSRGDVQPLVALALQLRTLGQEVRLCVPPDFRAWIDSLGLPVTPIGPELRKLTASSPPAAPAPIS